MRLLILLGAALAGVLLFLLATASGNTTLFASHYPLLLGLNAALAALLAALVAWQIHTLWRKYRARAFGSRLTVRLLLLLALMAVVPGALVYTVSVQFLSKSIESWFDVKVDAALEGGINLGQSAIDRMQGELQAKARSIALELADRPAGQQVVLLSRLRDQAGVQEAVIVNAAGLVLAEASEDVSRLVPDELPTPQALRQARARRIYTAVDAAAGKPLAVRVVVPVGGLALADETRFLQLRQAVPEQFARSAEAVESAYRDYRELALSRQGLKRIYIVTLTLALSMALLVAIALSVVLANRLSEPLANLAQATQAVARGDFSRQAPVTSRDELGVLIESFNSMTRQLDDARRVVEANRTALESAKARLENILANLSAGVLVFDRDLSLSISNHGAACHPGRRAGAVRRGHARTVPLAWHAGLAARAGTEGHGQDAAGARHGAVPGSGGRLRAGIRRHHAADPGAAGDRMGRGGAAAGARNQESAHADPAVRRAAGDEAGRQARARGCGSARARHPDHRQPGGGAEEHGGRFPRLLAAAGAGAGGSRPERPGARSAGPVRDFQDPDRQEARARVAASAGGLGADPPGAPQSGAERAGCAREQEGVPATSR